MATNDLNITSQEETIIYFNEGMIGFPDLRQMALVSLPEFAPFFQMTSVKNPLTRFVVVDPQVLFPEYNPVMPPEIRIRLGLSPTDPPKTLVLVVISSDITKTKINLRAPIFINPATMRAAQAVLSESKYRLEEALPKHLLEVEGK